PEMVSRPRLVEQLNSGLHRKLTLISAPAGFGKTTLLSEWIGHSERPVAWLSLDATDNDLARFLAYFVGALHTIEGLRENVGALPEGMFTGLQAPGGAQTEAVLTALINEIAAFGEPFALVLDDYHLITAEAIQQAVAFLVDNLPAEMHLIIASRADPPLAIAGLRGRGQLTELRQADLRFTADEVSAFLDRVAGLKLSPRDISALSSRTEGWIAGLQMAALSLQGRDDVTQFVDAFTGSNVFVLDYLMEEVLERQSPATQSFLLWTSILDRLSGPACDAVTAGNVEEVQQLTVEGEVPPLTGQEMLEMLERSNLFIVRLDDERCWYRYHRLFADLLRQRLEQLHPGLPALLHRRASEWHERNGLGAVAIDHALAGRDFQRSVRLIETGADSTFMQAEFTTMRRWIEALPNDIVQGRPLLSAYYGLALLLVGGTLEEVKACIAHASKGDSSGAFEGELAAVRALLASLDGDPQQSLELSRRALESLPVERTFLSRFVERNLGMIYMLSGDLEAARQVFERSARLGEKSGDFTSMVVAQEKLGTARRMQGRLRESVVLYEQAMDSATDEKGRRNPVVTKAVLGLADIMREWNDLEAAERLLQEGIELAQQWSQFLTMSCHLVQFRVRQARGDLEGAAELLERCQRLAAEWDLSEMDDIIVGASQTRIWLARGEFDQVRRWMENRGLSSAAAAAELEGPKERASLDYVRQVEYTALGRVYLAQGQAEQALRVLQPLSRATDRGGWGLLLIESLALLALALRSQGETEQALEVLERALSLGEPEGFVRTFVDEGEPMAQLLGEAAARGIAPRYVGKLLAAFEVAEHGPLEHIVAPSKTRPLPEPLSERELEVLRLLNTSLSSTEMADELFVSVNTVRTHIRSIYAKLDVHSRYQAVDRARELNLL
ncbi:MAG: tetratricopeptide repeat protein, partial [Anaerolineae bacterium]|nr:tetratricopeptide repeat protein [Anaerolineae bacterium]